MKRRIPVLKFLSDIDIEKIHNASLEVLTQTGVKVFHQEALKTLDELGCGVDYKDKRVKLSPTVIEEQIKKAPKSFIMGARNPKHDIRLESGSVYTRPVGGPDHIVDLRTDKWRKTNLTDVVEWATLIDALENIHYGMGIYPNDVPLSTRDVHTAKIMMENTEKHIQFQPYNAKNVQAIAEMAAVVQRGKDKLKKRPLVSMLISSLTPLCFRGEDIEMFQMCGRYGIPVMLNSTPQTGATSPVTIVGAVVLLNAEVLAANTLVQTLSPGTPVVCEIRPIVLDMSTSIPATGYIEIGIISAVAVQLARRYGFITDVFGPITDAKTINLQATMEKTYNTLLPALAGVNIIAGAGQLESTATTSPVQLVIDNDLMGAILRMLKGTEVSEETLATEVINQVGPGGHFLDTMHTYRHFRKEYYMSTLCNRDYRNIWENKNRPDMIEAAREKAKKILKEHRPVPLDRDVLREIKSIVEKFKG